MRNQVYFIFGVAVLIALWLTSAMAGERSKSSKYKLTVTAQYPQFDDAVVDKSLEEWLSSTLGGIVKDNSTEDFLLDLEDDAYEIGATYQAFHPSDKAMSVHFEIFTSASHAAHPLTQSLAISYLKGSAAPLGLDDLFADPQQALAIMAGQAKQKIMNYVETLAGEPLPEETRSMFDEDWFAEGSAPTRENYACLIPVPEGIMVKFQQYQVLPYVYGRPEYVVPLTDLAPAGPNAEVWALE